MSVTVKKTQTRRFGYITLLQWNVYELSVHRLFYSVVVPWIQWNLDLKKCQGIREIGSGWRISFVSIYHTIVFFARADWLARRWLAKYYSPPSSRRETKWLLVSLKLPKSKLFRETRWLFHKIQKMTTKFGLTAFNCYSDLIVRNRSPPLSIAPRTARFSPV